MKESHKVFSLGTPAEVALQEFLCERRSVPPKYDLESFERELHGLMMAIERDLVGEELHRYDIDAPLVNVGGEIYRRVGGGTETYTTAAGPVTVPRGLYRPVRGSGETICPMELRAGIVEGSWTPMAARLMALFVANLTPALAEMHFAEIGNMTPSRSSLERLPKGLSDRWEANRTEWEADLRNQETPPVEAEMIVNSLDGVLTPMKDGKRAEKRMSSVKIPKGPAGYREAAVATVSLHDKDGERLETVRFGRMPESKKVTLHGQLAAEYSHVRRALPLAQSVNLADGAAENWRILREVAPDGIEIVDFFHACEHLKKGLDAHLGKDRAEAKAMFAEYRVLLRDDDKGVEKVIATLLYRVNASKGARKKEVQAELTYFRNHKKQMRYSAFKRQGFPIGSGVVEASCKTLVTQRMKQSGMRWSVPGGQAILTLRSLIQSDSWTRGWEKIAQSYVLPVVPVYRTTLMPVNCAYAA